MEVHAWNRRNSTEGHTDVITDNSIVVVSDDLTTAELGGEAILLDVKSGNYFGLNEVGAYILELSKEPRSVASIIDNMLQEFDVEAERLTSDVQAFLVQLHRQGLIKELAQAQI